MKAKPSKLQQKLALAKQQREEELRTLYGDDYEAKMVELAEQRRLEDERTRLEQEKLAEHEAEVARQKAVIKAAEEKLLTEILTDQHEATLRIRLLNAPIPKKKE